jgi:hypothetical protein
LAQRFGQPQHRFQVRAAKDLAPLCGPRLALAQDFVLLQLDAIGVHGLGRLADHVLQVELHGRHVAAGRAGVQDVDEHDELLIGNGVQEQLAQGGDPAIEGIAGPAGIALEEAAPGIAAEW